MAVNADGTITRDERPGGGGTPRGGGGILPEGGGAAIQPGDTPTGGDITRGELPPLPPATSEMGMIIQMMLNQGIMRRPSVEELQRGIGLAPRTPPDGSIGDTATGAPGGPAITPGTQTEGGTTPDPNDPANIPEGWVKVNGRWVDPGVITPNMDPTEFQAIMQELMRNGFTIPVDSPLYARRAEILREIRRYDPNVSVENSSIGGGGEGGGQGTAAIRLNFDQRTLGNAPAVETATPALRALLNSGLYNAAGGGIDLYGYDDYQGAEMLRQLQRYDPNAHWEDRPIGTNTSGSEGGLDQNGRRLVYDRSKLPISQAEAHGWDLAPVEDDTRMFRPEMTYYDPIYGRVTDRRNIKQDPTAWWEVAAPIAISLLAPYAAPALFGAMGAGAVGAGATSAVTAGAAGLSGAQVPGSLAAFGGPLSTQAMNPWYTKPAAMTTIRTAAPLAGNMLDPEGYRIPTPDPNRVPTVPVRPAGGGTVTPPPPPPPAVTTPATTVNTNTNVRPVGNTSTTPGGGATPVQGGGGRTPLGQDAGYTPQNYGKSATAPLARNQVLNDPYGAPRQQGVVSPKVSRYADMYGFDPAAFNSGGSTTKPGTNNSKLVATQFADDPYRFS